MTRLLCNLALFALLFVNAEAVTELVDHGQAHVQSPTHEHLHHGAVTHEGETTHADAEGAHCEHCCHVHFWSIAHLHPTMGSIERTGQTIELSHEAMPKFVISPPTPPPDQTYLC